MKAMLRESRNAEEYAIVLRAAGATGLAGLFESVRLCVEVDRSTDEWCSRNNVRLSALWSLANLAAAVPHAVRFSSHMKSALEFIIH